jgi:hypothetical protein
MTEQIGVQDSNGREICVGDVIRVTAKEHSIEFKILKERGAYWVEPLSEDYIESQGIDNALFFDSEANANIKDYCDDVGGKLEVIDV